METQPNTRRSRWKRAMGIGTSTITALAAALFLDIAWTGLWRLVMPVNRKGVEIGALVGLAAAVILFVAVGRRCRTLRISVHVLGGAVLALWIAMGFYAACKTAAVPVPVLERGCYYGSPVEEGDYDVYAFGWKAEGPRVADPPALPHLAQGTYVQVSFGYHHGLKPNLPAIALRNPKAPGAYWGIVAYVEVQYVPEPCRTGLYPETPCP